MADVTPFIPKIFPWETGVTIDKASQVKMAFDKADPGGYTKFGITLATWISRGYDKDGDGDIDKDDLALIDVADYATMVKVNFWDQWKADHIKTQSIAENLVDWVWASGAYGITEMQKFMGLRADGVVGIMTLNAINNYPDQRELHNAVNHLRFKFIDRITTANIQTYMTKGFPKQGIPANPNPTEADLMRDTFKRFNYGWKRRVSELYSQFVPVYVKPGL